MERSPKDPNGFKPIGHFVVSFGSANSRNAAVRALEPIRWAGGSVTPFALATTSAHSADAVDRECRGLGADQAPRTVQHWLAVWVPDAYLADWVIETMKGLCFQCIQSRLGCGDEFRGYNGKSAATRVGRLCRVRQELPESR